MDLRKAYVTFFLMSTAIGCHSEDAARFQGASPQEKESQNLAIEQDLENAEAGFSIRNGTEDINALYPHSGAILVQNGSEYQFICSGVLIDNDLVLTAAHCFDNLTSSDNIVYSTTAQLTPGTLPHHYILAEYQKSDVMQYWVHESYFPDSLPNDIALMRIDEEHSGTFPPLWQNPTTVPSNTLIDTVGYGLDENYQTGKRRIGSVYFSYYSSSGQVLNSYDGPTNQIACSGDSGSGTYISYNGQEYLFGILTTGYSTDCNANFAQSGTAIYPKRQWIDDISRVLHRAWQNPVAPHDINNDGHISPLDALVIINLLNRDGGGLLTPASGFPPQNSYFYDPNGDGRVSPLDALIVINELNRAASRPIAEDPPLDVYGPQEQAVIDAHQANDQEEFDLLYDEFAYDLDQEKTFAFSNSYYQNSGARNEKWFYSSSQGWHYVTPDGKVWRALGYDGNGVVQGQISAYLTTAFYWDPAKIHDAENPGTSSDHTVFITSTTHTGNLGGIAGADSICQNLANGAGLTGTWKAIISDSQTDARDRIVINGPVYNMNNQLLANDANDFWDGTLANTIKYNENGWQAYWHLVLTGTDPDGTADPSTCSNWTSSSGAVQTGRVEYSDYRWLAIYTGYAGNACSNLGQLYCFQ